jgi:P27 family predicted phage terminase small subunit
MSKTPKIISFQSPAPPEPAPEPPGTLGSTGSTLWRTVMGRYVLNAPEAELLLLACEARDRAEALRLEIEAMGLTVQGAIGQSQVNPLLAVEGAAQMRCASLLRQLGLFREGKRDKPGRPPKFGGW